MVQTEVNNRNQVQLTDGTGPNLHANWSPDGQQIVYVSGQTGRLALYIMQLSSRKETLLIEGGIVSHPVWSPLGNVIAFASDRDGEMALYTIQPDGTNLQRLTPPGMSFDWPNWSPDGERLAYASDRSGDWEIYHQRYEVERGILVDDVVQLTTSIGRDVMPVWLPDGQRLAFVSERDALLQIYVMPITADELVRVTYNQFNDWGPTWLDNSTILFHSFRGDEMSLYQINWLRGGEVPFGVGVVDAFWPAARRY